MKSKGRGNRVSRSLPNPTSPRETERAVCRNGHEAMQKLSSVSGSRDRETGGSGGVILRVADGGCRGGKVGEAATLLDGHG